MQAKQDQKQDQKQPRGRMPQRSGIVRGRVDRAGQPIENLDKRTATRDPNVKPEKSPKPAA